MTLKIAVNGYGTIGKRIADAVRKNKDFELVGVAKYNVDYSVFTAINQGIKIYTPREKIREFRDRGIEPEGDLEYLVSEAELIYDASPAKQGARNKELYLKFGKPAVFQGGERPDVADISYSTLCNYKSAIGSKYVRVVSCNTTGILRILCSLDIGNIRDVFGVIIRRASDPREDYKGPVSSIALDMDSIPSHHASDVKTVIGEIPIKTVAVVVPSTLMHVQVVRISFRTLTSTSSNYIREQLESSKRIIILDTGLYKIESTGKLVELARDIGRARYDIYENIVFSSGFNIDRDTMIIMQAIHQESIVIPENIDVAYAMMNMETDPVKVVEKTNSILGVGSIKSLLASHVNMI